MSRKTASPELTRFFEGEVQELPSANLEIAREHLESLEESAPGDSTAQLHEWLMEVNELIDRYHEHCPLTDFLPGYETHAHA